MNGHKREEAEVVSGVAQGSVVGHLLFLIHMEDIGERVGNSSPYLLMTSVSAIQSLVWKKFSTYKKTPKQYMFGLQQATCNLMKKNLKC